MRKARRELSSRRAFLRSKFVLGARRRVPCHPSSVLAARARGQLALINLRARGDELSGLLLHAFAQRRLLVELLLRGVVAHVLRDLRSEERRVGNECRAWWSAGQC